MSASLPPRAAGVVVVDSSVRIDFLNRHRTPEVGRLSALLGTESLLVGDAILLEAPRGLRSETDAKRVEQAFRPFDVVPTRDPDLAGIAAAGHAGARRAEVEPVRLPLEITADRGCSSFRVVGRPVSPSAKPGRRTSSVRDANGRRVIRPFCSCDPAR